MYLTKQELYVRIERYRQKLLDADVPFPFSLNDILSASPNITFSYADFDTQGLRGMAFVNYDGHNNHGILLKSTLSKGEQNFHGVHEIMHTVLHSNLPKKGFSCYEQIRNNQNRSIEWQANEGAAELLMPYREFIPLFLELYNRYMYDQENWMKTYSFLNVCDILAKKYGVTNMVVQNRVSTLSYEIEQYSNGIPIENIMIVSHNRQIQLGIKAKDYINMMSNAASRNIFCFGFDSIIL